MVGSLFTMGGVGFSLLGRLGIVRFVIVESGGRVAEALSSFGQGKSEGILEKDGMNK